MQRIQAWISVHPRATYLDPAALVGELDISPKDVADALVVLVDRNMLRVRYKAQSPYSQSLTDKTFDSPLEVDEELYDVGENRFSREDAEIVPIFVGVIA